MSDDAVSTAPVVLDVTDETFASEVVERSQRVPVVVDLWAPWCGPCKQLGPILERVVGETRGQVVLARVDVDQSPQVASQFQVQGIPAVYAVSEGKVVDGFTGAQGEDAVRAFVNRLAPTEAEKEDAERLAAGDEESLRAILERRPDHPEAVIALAELLIDDGRADEALTLLARVPETAEVRRVAARARQGGQTPDGDDVDARLEALLERVKTDEDARQEFLDTLELLGPEDPRTARWRKALTTALY